MPMRAGSTRGWCSSTSRERARSHRFWVSGRPPAHHLVDQVGVAAVVVRRVPVGPLAEAAKVGGQHDMAATGQLRRRSRRPAGHPVRVPHTRDLPGPWPWTASTARPGVARPSGTSKIGGHRHGVLGVEDDPLAPEAQGGPVVVVVGLVGDLEVQRDQLGPRGQRILQSGFEPRSPGVESGEVAHRAGRPRSTVAISRLTAWNQGEKLRVSGNGVRSWWLPRRGPVPIGPARRSTHVATRPPVEPHRALGHTGVMEIPL